MRLRGQTPHLLSQDHPARLKFLVDRSISEGGGRLGHTHSPEAETHRVGKSNKVSQEVTMSLDGKHALITGSSRGIGRGIALKLAELGARVAVHYYQNETAANA